MIEVTVAAPCKVNLTLDVFAPRPDGFHELESLTARFTPADEVTVTVGARALAGESITLTCNDGSLPTDERNLAYRAAAAFVARFCVGDAPTIGIRLTKRLPHQAGLGGGSSDAAAVLRALSRIFPVDPEALIAVGATIGSDVPLFFLDAPIVRMYGRGEIVSPVAGPMPRLHGVIVKPATGVPTQVAYRLLDEAVGRVQGTATRHIGKLLAGGADIAAIGHAMHNDFEAAILPAFPPVAEAHRAVSDAGAVRALLCGSGAAIFGLATDDDHARAMAQALNGRFPYVAVAAGIDKDFYGS